MSDIPQNDYIGDFWEVEDFPFYDDTMRDDEHPATDEDPELTDDDDVSSVDLGSLSSVWPEGILQILRMRLTYVLESARYHLAVAEEDLREYLKLLNERNHLRKLVEENLSMQNSKNQPDADKKEVERTGATTASGISEYPNGDRLGSQALVTHTPNSHAIPKDISTAEHSNVLSMMSDCQEMRDIISRGEELMR